MQKELELWIMPELSRLIVEGYLPPQKPDYLLFVSVACVPSYHLLRLIPKRCPPNISIQQIDPSRGRLDWIRGTPALVDIRQSPMKCWYGSDARDKLKTLIEPLPSPS